MIPPARIAATMPVPPPIPAAVTDWQLERAAARLWDSESATVRWADLSPAERAPRVAEARRWAQSFGLLDEAGALTRAALVALQP